MYPSSSSSSSSSTYLDKYSNNERPALLIINQFKTIIMLLRELMDD